MERACNQDKGWRPFSALKLKGLACRRAFHRLSFVSSILVFIPAYNEKESIGAVIADVQRVLPEADVMVVDDGSTDGTAQAAREAGAAVAILPFNQGLGAALQTGYLEALRNDYEICAHLDADGQHRAEDLARLVAAARDGDCDLAVGSRYLEPTEVEGAYKPSPLRSIGSSIFRRLLTWATRQQFTDTTSGLRAANRRVITRFAGTYAPDFAELESLQRAISLGLRVQEYPVVMLPRAAGKSKIGGFKSAHFTFKSTLVLIVGVLRRRRDQAADRKLFGDA